LYDFNAKSSLSIAPSSTLLRKAHAKPDFPLTRARSRHFLEVVSLPATVSQSDVFRVDNYRQPPSQTARVAAA
jgi:hypothetical protein